MPDPVNNFNDFYIFNFQSSVRRKYSVDYLDFLVIGSSIGTATHPCTNPHLSYIYIYIYLYLHMLSNNVFFFQIIFMLMYVYIWCGRLYWCINRCVWVWWSVPQLRRSLRPFRRVLRFFYPFYYWVGFSGLSKLFHGASDGSPISLYVLGLSGSWSLGLFRII